ncbi:MAG TPA: hypothetical protein VFC50_03195, partial [Candidatus Dormibacteraeota bacterium]|nr:hypothetical protein [Candidatus Dormibacteraeota bacterium]
PYAAAKAAAAAGVEIWGFSSSADEAAQRAEYPDDDLSIYAKVTYVPSEFPFVSSKMVCKKYRNVISVATCDAAIVISGRWGTLNEFTNLIDMNKTIGILTGTGGVTNELPQLAQKISKPGQGEMIFDDQVEALVQKIFKVLKG